MWANTGAIVTAAVAARLRQLWWTDPAGGILISALIIYRWTVITASSVAKVVRTAIEEREARVWPSGCFPSERPPASGTPSACCRRLSLTEPRAPPALLRRWELWPMQMCWTWCRCALHLLT